MTLAAPDTTLAGLLDLLRRQHDVIARPAHGHLWLGTARELGRRLRPPELPPSELRLHPVPVHLSPAQLADAYCRAVAGPNGQAVVLGRHVLVADTPLRQELFERLVERLGTGDDGRDFSAISGD